MRINFLALCLFVILASAVRADPIPLETASPHSGEIRLDGEIVTIPADRKTITVLVWSFTLPSGKASGLEQPKRKQILIDGKVRMLLEGAGVQKDIAAKDLYEWMPVAIIGKDTGRGPAVPPRLVVVRDPPAYNPTIAKATQKPSSLMQAASWGTPEEVERELNRGADINEQDEFGNTPLIKAASNGRTETVKLLLSRGADIAAINRDGQTPLLAASCFIFEADAVKLLIEKGADVNAVDRVGMTALMMACGLGRDEKVNVNVKLLLEAGADPNKRTWPDHFALEFAVLFDHPKTVSLLLEKGAHDMKNKYGSTMQDLADRMGKDEIAQILQDAAQKAN